jgi:hypothetical protein
MNGLWKGGKHGEGTQTTRNRQVPRHYNLIGTQARCWGSSGNNPARISNPVNPFASPP